MKDKDKVIIVRITEEEDKIVKELRKKYSVNISNLIREFLRDYYENKTTKEKETRLPAQDKTKTLKTME